MAKISPAERMERAAGIALALALGASLALPWLSALGFSLRGYALREYLESPHRLVSYLVRDARLSLAYSLSLWLWALPAVALAALGGAFAKPAWGPIQMAAGAIGVAAFLFLRHQAAAWPLHRIGMGAYLALGAGAGLVAIGLLRFLRKPG